MKLKVWSLTYKKGLRSCIPPIDVLSDHAIKGSNWRVTRFKASQPARGNNLISSNSQELPHKTQADPSWGACHQDYSAWHCKSAIFLAEISWVRSTFLEGVSLVLAVLTLPELFWHHSSSHISLDLSDRFFYDCTVHLNYWELFGKVKVGKQRTLSQKAMFSNIQDYRM